jgi:hypothetical protein
VIAIAHELLAQRRAVAARLDPQTAVVQPRGRPAGGDLRTRRQARPVLRRCGLEARRVKVIDFMVANACP